MNRRLVFWIVAAVVGVNAVLFGLDAIAPGPTGRPSSSLATTPRGFSAWAELAQRNGVSVVSLRSSLAGADLPPDATIVALDVRSLPRRDGRALRAFADAGGRIVAGGNRPQRVLDALGVNLSWSASGPHEATVADRRLQLAGRGSFSDGVFVRRGSLSLLADSSPLQNARLASADNAAFALDLAGRGPLIFAERAHGYGDATGLAALPGRAKGALILLLVAALALMLARGRRFGPVEPEARELAPPRAAYIDALAATLARTKR